MAGLLVYTAAGDAEGTMGGLVRMGSREHLARTLEHALADSDLVLGGPGMHGDRLTGGTGD